MNRMFSVDSVDLGDDFVELSESDEEDVIVKEKIFDVHFPSHKGPFRVQLTKKELIFEEFNESQKKLDQTHEDEDNQDNGSECDSIVERYPVKDIFGFHIVRKENEEPSIPAVYVCLIFYTKAGQSQEEPKSCVRKRVVRILQICGDGKSYKDNLDVAKDWAGAIAKRVEVKCPNLHFHRLRSKTERPSIQARIEEAFKYLKLGENLPQTKKHDDDKALIKDDVDKLGQKKNGIINVDLEFDNENFVLVRSILFERKFLVVVNPVSGQGKSTNLFQDQISPILQDCGISTDVRTTEYSHHALSLMSHIDLVGYDGILSVGGDGLLNEIVNGLRTRKDSERFADIPIGIIATGSGNGLARSIAGYCNIPEEEYKSEPVLHTVLSVARGCVVPVNLTEVTLDKRVFYSFLSVGWGLLADIDIESEVLRAIGEFRFFIWSFIRLAKLRRYKASLSYIPHDTSGSIKGRVTVDDEFVSVYSVCQSHIGSAMLFAPDAKPNDNTIHLTYMPGVTGRYAAAWFLHELDKGRGNQLAVEPGKYVKVKEFTISCEGGIEGCLTVDGEQVKGEEITVKLCDTPLLMMAFGRAG